MRASATSTVRPRYSLLDVVGLLFRELWLMIVVFLAIVALGAGFVLTIKKTYTARASVYAGAGQEYAYEPRVGTAERANQPLEADQVAQSEATILGSLEVKRRTVDALGPDAILGPDARGTPAQKRIAAMRLLDGGLDIGVTPGSPIIALSFEADEPNRAARVLNGLVSQYLEQRRSLFREANTDAIVDQRRAFESELAEADDAYQSFLNANGVGDFATAKATLSATYQTTYAETLSVRAQLNQATQRLATLERQLAQQPAEVVLQQDLNVSAQDQITNLRTEREQLLSRYTAEAQPVQDIDQRIAQLQAYVSAGAATGVREVRTGPSAIFTEIETTRINAAADRDALAARLAVLNRQLDAIRSRQARLTELESANAILSGDREVLNASIREFQQRETRSRADSALIAAGADNVRLLASAEAPTRGTSLKAPLLAAVILFAGFTALCIGLLRVFTRPGFATPQSAGRTLNMPVLAVAPAKVR